MPGLHGTHGRASQGAVGHFYTSIRAGVLMRMTEGGTQGREEKKDALIKNDKRTDAGEQVGEEEEEKKKKKS